MIESLSDEFFDGDTYNPIRTNDTEESVDIVMTNGNIELEDMDFDDANDDLIGGMMDGTIEEQTDYRQL